MRNQKVTISAICFATLAVGVTLAHETSAGIKAAYPVQVDLATRTASGSFGSARNTSDWRQTIGCSLQATAGVADLALWCEAMDAHGVTIMCATSDANLVTVSLAISGDSYVSFTWDRSNQCTTLRVWNGSAHDPKGP